MKLIIAEKPSQAKEYAKALGSFHRKDGYLQNNQYYITWCFGHLIQLERDEAYREPGKWSKNYLPIIPKKYLYTIGLDSKGKEDSGKKKQLKIIEKLMQNSTEVINGTDADREGELIFLYVYNFLNCKLPFKRLWISSLTKGDILKGFKNLRTQEEMYHLGKSAHARAIADWLVGINGTQASTLHFGNGTLLTIGRVQTAILKIICERYLKNKNFQKSYSYKLKAEHKSNIVFSSETEIYETKSQAETLLSKLDKNNHKCLDIFKSIKKQSPPLLFSIDTLIIESAKIFDYTGEETLSTAQHLYEHKLISYPRTDTEYINDENFEELQKFLPKLAEETINADFDFSKNKPKSVNSKKLTGSHDAIVPTGDITNLKKINNKELDIFKLIICRCLQSFSESAEYEKTKISFENNGIPFFTHLSKLIKPGWKIYDPKFSKENKEDLNINFVQNDLVKVLNFEIKEIEAKPPELYSEVNLTKDLTNFGKLLKEENPELLKEIKSNIDVNSLQIGTQATRPGIISRLKKLDFIKSTGKFIPTEKGLKYYQIFKDLAVSDVVTTAIWEMKLKHVAEGKEDIRIFYNEIRLFTEQIVSDIFSNETTISFKKEKSYLGICPKCKKGNVLENKKAYSCTEWKQGCDFTIWKELAGKKISPSALKDLISKKTTRILKGFNSKKGNKFDAKLVLDKDFKVTFEFNNK